MDPDGQAVRAYTPSLLLSALVPTRVRTKGSRSLEGVPVGLLTLLFRPRAETLVFSVHQLLGWIRQRFDLETAGTGTPRQCFRH